LAVPTDGNEREIGFENRAESQHRLSRPRQRSVPEEIHSRGRRGEEQFLPADCKGRSKTELNNLGIPRAALYTMNWLRIMWGGVLSNRMFLVRLSGWMFEPWISMIWKDHACG